ncbi:TetR/AcrR family transcriptional regulator [Stigmatella sp. ncwal1]|uniref:TetR/AcrR family transcriptional regulator n=1 Tax=Stigmatella ashevillensis TaxID=2995309 RepID=A0ABT5D4U0_9BACT|nr:TetR/AcrR family transcriptional regulator [Stigmatella ashevillena]MDC0708687.1 TetR/AcrR family transcriptional regulator [Stigmatella ashevillena]
MRYGPEHKQATHTRILTAAESLFRQHGFEGASVERVMRAAGLTVGGFYAHFSSKEALLSEALRDFLQKRRERWMAGIEELRGKEWLSHFTRRYLNRQLRDDPGTGCLMPSLLSDLTRASPAIQATFAEGLDALAREAQTHLDDEKGVTARQKALASIALCFGTMTLARATASHPFSDELLAAARALLLTEEETPSSPPRPR